MKKILSYEIKHKKFVIFIIISFLLICFFNPFTFMYIHGISEEAAKRQYEQKFDSVLSPLPSGFSLTQEDFQYVMLPSDAISNITRTYKVNSTRAQVLQALQPLFNKHNITVDNAVDNQSYSSYWDTGEFRVYLDPNDESMPHGYPYPGSTPVNKVTIQLY